MKRRLAVIGLVVLILSAVILAPMILSSAPPFRFIHGRRVQTAASTLVLLGWGAKASTRSRIYCDYYVFPGSVKEVRKEAEKELASLGYDSAADYMFVCRNQRATIDIVWIGGPDRPRILPDRNGKEVRVPAGYVAVAIQRRAPNFIESVQEFAHKLGL